MIIKQIALIASVLFLTACAGPAYFEPQSISVNGQYIQESSGMTYPEMVGSFQRAYITTFEEHEANVGVSYHHVDRVSPIVATVYSTQAPTFISMGSPQNVKDEVRAQLFSNVFEANKSQILISHDDSSMVAEGIYSFSQQNQVITGQYAKFYYKEKFDGSIQDLESWLYLFQIDKTLYKYRITHPILGAVTSKMENFMTQLTLPVPEK